MTISGRFMIPLCALALSASAMAQETSWVDSTLASLSLEEKIGQLFVAELVGLYTPEDHPAYQYALEMIKRYHVGSFILAGGSLLDIPLITNKLQCVSKVPLLINADFEGGMTYMHPWRLNRGWSEQLPRYIAGGGTQFPSQMAIGATGEPRYAYELGRVTALEARAIGIQWTNSPVADVNNNADNPIINTRSYGEDPKAVATMVQAYVRGAQEGGLIATLKHFPGHGDTREDTHMGLPSLPFDVHRLDSVELVSFRAGIAAGAKAVMTAHIALPKIDPSGRPSTLSRPIITGILRERLGFQGMVVTDGMRMQGITDNFSAADAAVDAIEAGGDLILGSADIDSAYHSLVRAVRHGRISESRIDTSVRRILSAKAWVGLGHNRTIQIDSIFTRVGTAASHKIAQEISDASVVLLRNHDGLLPLASNARIQIIAVTEDPGFVVGTDLYDELASSSPSASLVRVSNETGSERFGEIASASKDCDAIIVGVYLTIAAWKGEQRFSQPLQEFLGALPRLARPVILVAFGDPYVLGKIPETSVVMTPFNGTRLAEISVAKAVTGRIGITGRLPVTIPGRYPRGAGIRLTARN
jgi:beta-N-acetylhexosaminidase